MASCSIKNTTLQLLGAHRALMKQIQGLPLLGFFARPSSYVLKGKSTNCCKQECGSPILKPSVHTFSIRSSQVAHDLSVITIPVIKCLQQYQFLVLCSHGGTEKSDHRYGNIYTCSYPLIIVMFSTSLYCLVTYRTTSCGRDYGLPAPRVSQRIREHSGP